MAQNIYDNATFFDNYAQLPRSVHGLEGAPEWPTLEAMLPALEGKQVLDLGCGYGWFARYARERGAEHVVGIDLSHKMLARAAELTDDEAITYQCADMASLVLEPARFDVIYSSLAFHYLADIAALFGCLYQALEPGGTLVFSTEHPIFTCARHHQGWVEHQGRRYWAVSDYQHEGQRQSDWLAPGVVKYHRTLGTTLNALLSAGFIVEQVNEWGPDSAQIAQQPGLAEEAERPMLVLIAACKPCATPHP